MPLDTLFFYVPLGVVGLVRWVSWVIRRIPATFYRTISSGYRAPITVVSPVFQEDPAVFAEAIESWLANKHVVEVICVIHDSDHACQAVAARYPVKVLTGPDPRKRQAMRRGWEQAATPLVALADSDTVWARDLSDRICEPFADPAIGGVGTRQNVIRPRTVWHRLNDIYLDYRYFDEIASQTALGQAVSCLSGRSVVYRRELLNDVAEDFTSETFLGVPCLSGDDKRLTTLALQRGWRTYLQRSARCWSALPSDAPNFFRQRLRWSRNTWRNDLRALGAGWVFSHPFLAFCVIDKAISPFTQLLSPTYFTLAIVRGNWLFAGILVTWWLVSRGVKILPHFRRRPRDIAILPVFILLTFVMAVVKIYALLTCRRQGWLTRHAPSVETPTPRLLRERSVVLTRPTLPGLRVAAVVALAGLALVVPTALPQPEASLTERGSTAQLPEPGYVGGHPAKCLAEDANPTECRDLKDLTIDPFSSSASPQLRGIRVHSDRIELFKGGDVVRTLEFDGASRWIRLRDIAKAIDDRSWIRDTGEGVYELRAALRQEKGTRLLVGGPTLHVLRLVDAPGVSIRGIGAIARFEDVLVTSWLADRGEPDRDVTDGRPFVLYEHGSTLDIADSVFEHLGTDTKRSFGVAWLTRSSGRAERSIFRRNFFGIHIAETSGVLLRDNTFVANSFYGVNVHTSAVRITAAHNVARNNGAHGFALAEGVRHTHVVDNHIHDNGGNGVLVFLDSVGNRIDHNTIERNLDGIALVDSPGNRIEANTITGHRTGIRIQGRRSTENILKDNSIHTSGTGIRVYGQPAVARLLGNTIVDTTGHGIIADALRTSVLAGEVREAAVGLDVRGDTEVRALRIDTRHGVFVRPGAGLALSGARVTAAGFGLRLDDRSDVQLSTSTVMAPTPVSVVTSGTPTAGGALMASHDARLIRRPKPVYSWLPYVGLLFVLAAAALEFVRRARSTD